MPFPGRRGSNPFAWGVTLGVAAALYLAWRMARPDGAGDAARLDPETVRTIAAGALLADRELRRFDLEVRVIAPGILDVSGTVDSTETASRAMEVVRSARGARTVLNRLDIQPQGASGRVQAES